MAFHKAGDKYRREQELFVSNHSGSTPNEIIISILPNILSILLMNTIVIHSAQYLTKNSKICLEFITLMIPCILSYTIFSDHLIFMNITLVITIIINIFVIIVKSDSIKIDKKALQYEKRPFLTNFRSLTSIITSVCILAVDFPVFPRKFVKTETLGYSLMDTGVGLFIISNALVTKEARNFGTSITQQSIFPLIIKHLKTSLKNTLPLLILGLGRIIFVELFNYQKHVSEYGTHWNFFLTLACVKLFISLISTSIDLRRSLFSGLWILGMYEFSLQNNNLKHWILRNDMRENDFISANREGLLSLSGYLGLYLIGIFIGQVIHSTYINPQLRKSLKFKVLKYNMELEYDNSALLCLKLSLISIIFCVATLICNHYFGISRRLANFGYCSWILALSSAILSLLLFIEIITDIIISTLTENENESKVTKKRNKEKLKSELPRKKLDVEEAKHESMSIKVPEIFEAVNYNGLLFFLTSNLLTGLINICIKTLYVTDMNALYIITFYTICNLIFVVTLYRCKLQIRL